LLHIRNLEENDFEFLLDMMYEAIYIPQNKPPKEELLNSPHIKKYHEGWGRKGDRALIAFRDNQPGSSPNYCVNSPLIDNMDLMT
jgi:hypothetical protein